MSDGARLELELLLLTLPRLENSTLKSRCTSSNQLTTGSTSSKGRSIYRCTGVSSAGIIDGSRESSALAGKCRVACPRDKADHVCMFSGVCSTSQATPPHARMPRSEENCSINPFDKIARLYGGLRHKMRRSSDRDMAVRGKNITRRRAT